MNADYPRDGDKTGLREALDRPRLKLSLPMVLGTIVSGLAVATRAIVDPSIESWSLQSWLIMLLPTILPMALSAGRGKK